MSSRIASLSSTIYIIVKYYGAKTERSRHFASIAPCFALIVKSLSNLYLCFTVTMQGRCIMRSVFKTDLED